MGYKDARRGWGGPSMRWRGGCGALILGIDLEQKFVDLSEERIRQEQSQLKLDLGR
ncbi:MAG: hypothetical protein ACXABF_13890 [Candidatus Thorarchaeota archaeon]|jgi:hypothetical protein